MITAFQTWIPLLLSDPSPCLRMLVLRELLRRPDDDPEVLELANLLEADLVKFAKYLPLPEEADAAMTQAETIIEQSVAYHATPIVAPALNSREPNENA